MFLSFFNFFSQLLFFQFFPVLHFPLVDTFPVPPFCHSFFRYSFLIFPYLHIFCCSVLLLPLSFPLYVIQFPSFPLFLFYPSLSSLLVLFLVFCFVTSSLLLILSSPSIFSSPLSSLSFLLSSPPPSPFSCLLSLFHSHVHFSLFLSSLIFLVLSSSSSSASLHQSEQSPAAHDHMFKRLACVSIVSHTHTHTMKVFNLRH